MWAYNYTQSFDELYHYGILGMKWGRRKTRYYNISGNRNSTKLASRDSHSPNRTSKSYSGHRNNIGRKYVTTTVAGALGAMSVNLAAHSLFKSKYKSGKAFVANMANSALFGASVASTVASVRMGNDTRND